MFDLINSSHFISRRNIFCVGWGGGGGGVGPHSFVIKKKKKEKKTLSANFTAVVNIGGSWLWANVAIEKMPSIYFVVVANVANCDRKEEDSDDREQLGKHDGMQV